MPDGSAPPCQDPPPDAHQDTQGEGSVLVGYEAGPTQEIKGSAPLGPVFFNVPGQVVRYEYIRGREVTAAGATQTHYLPVVVYLEFGRGDRRSDLLGRAVMPAENPGSCGYPIGVADAAAEGPGSAHHVSPIHRRRATCGRENARGLRSPTARKKLLYSLVGEKGPQVAQAGGPNH